MILVSNKEARKIFLTKDTRLPMAFNSKVDIIVSPEFYWVRKFEIPVKTEAQAKNVLPTLFEDIVNEEQSLNYYVIKLEDNQFLCFAYNNKKIYDIVKNLNIPTSNIRAFYFAQNELNDFSTFEIDNQKFTYTKEGILIKIPNILVEDAINLDEIIDKVKLSDHKLQVKLYNDILSTKFYYSLFFIISILAISNLIKQYSYSSQIDFLNMKTEKIKKINQLPESMIQTDSILQSYEKSVKEQIQIREAIDYIIQNKSLNLNSMIIENKTINLEYLSATKIVVENYLKKRFNKIDFNQNSLTLKVRIEL